MKPYNGAQGKKLAFLTPQTQKPQGISKKLLHWLKDRAAWPASHGWLSAMVWQPRAASEPHANPLKANMEAQELAAR